MTDSPAPDSATLTRASARGRIVLVALTLGSGIAILDGSIVNVALRSIGSDLGAGIDTLTWVVNGYLLTLASLVLVGGALGDRLGRRRVYLSGVVLFMVASALCGFAQSPGQLVAMRAIQGIGAALLTPGALSIIQSSYRAADRPGAIGIWSGYSGIAAAAGPLLGGWIVDNTTWRWVFLINVPLCLVVAFLTWRYAPESRDEEASRRPFDFVGAALTVIALGASTFALSSAGSAGARIAAGVVAVATAIAFVVVERRSNHPLVPLTLFSSRVFSAANAMTLLVYGALGAVMFFLVLQLQAAGWSALAAGLAGLPITLALMLFSSRAGELAARIGPRIPMTVGPLLCSAGVLLLLMVGADASWLQVLPGVVVFALGLALLVAPLTSAVLAAAPDRLAGVASGVNNAVARSGSLLAVAALPALVGLTGDSYLHPEQMTSAFHAAMWWCAGLLAAGGIISWFGLARETHPTADRDAYA